MGWSWHWHDIEVAQSCPTLCDPMDCSLPGSSIHGIFQARVLQWVAMSFSRRSSQPRDRTRVSISSLHKMCYALSLSHVWLCDLVDWSPSGSSVLGDSPGKNTGMDCHAPPPPPGDLPNPEIESRSPTLQVDSLPTETSEKPKWGFGIAYFLGIS